MDRSRSLREPVCEHRFVVAMRLISQYRAQWAADGWGNVHSARRNASAGDRRDGKVHATRRKEPTKHKKRHETLIFTPQHPRHSRLPRRRGGLYYSRARSFFDCRSADGELPHIRRLQDQDAFYTQAARTLQDADTKQNHDEASQREDLLRLCRSGAKPALHW